MPIVRHMSTFMDDYLEQLGIREPSPLVSLEMPFFLEKGLNVHIKQEFLIHSVYGGNKWRKLKYNLQHFLNQGYDSLWTFGGAFSNHLYAVAGICNALEIECHGIIRDSLTKDQTSQTLAFAKSMGMKLHFATRLEYRDKEKALEKFSQGFDNIYVLPEGGANSLAVRGCSEIVAEVNNQLNEKPGYWVCSAGSGGMAAGLLDQLDNNQRLLVFPALKGTWMKDNILKYLPNLNKGSQLQVFNDFHFGGYARHDDRLIGFMHEWHKSTGIPLDPIYNGKAFFGFCELVRQGYFPEGSSIVLVHSGGLQGIPSFNLRNALQLPTA